jgi:hypothetical protein
MLIAHGSASFGRGAPTTAPDASQRGTLDGPVGVGTFLLAAEMAGVPNKKQVK